MSFFLIVTLAFTAGAAVLIVKRRSQRAASRSGRYRSPRAGLNLERPACHMGKSRRGAGGHSSALAGPIFLAVVVVVMVFWVAAAFFLPEGQTRADMVSETRANAAFPEQYGSLAGPLSPDPAGINPARPGDLVQMAANDSTAGGLLTAAAQSMAMGNGSFLTQVGLLSGRTASRPPRATGQPEQAASSLAKPSAVSAPGQPGPALSGAPSSSVSTATVVAASQVAAESAASASSAPKTLSGGAATPGKVTQSAGIKVPDKIAEAPSRVFTVHLSSFTDQANAERYRSKLTEAGEDAQISQVTMEGRQWYRVMSGRFKSRSAAEAYGTDLKRRGLTAEAGHYLVKSLD